MSKKGPLVIIITSALLIVANFINAGNEGYNLGFWLRTVSSLLLISAMYLSIRHLKK